MRKTVIIIIALLAASVSVYAAEKKKKQRPVEPSYAWEASMPLGVMTPATIDTTYINYAQQFIPSMVSPAYATTGNFGAEGINMIYPQRERMSDFYFIQPLTNWIPPLDKFKYYNTRIPMTLLSYNFGGGTDTNQDRINAIFSGNVNKAIQIGGYIDYLYSKGMYSNQATKDYTWGLSGSYIGDRYKMQMAIFSYNLLNKENGGITDDRYITDPEKVQGGQASVNTKQIPTNLNDAHTRVKGLDFFLNNKYSLGYKHTWRADTDTIDRSEFIPVTDIIWTLQARTNSHLFTNKANSADTPDFWTDDFYNTSSSSDLTNYTYVNNTIGVELLEGCHKWAKFGLTAFATHEYSKIELPVYAPEDMSPEAALTPRPAYTPDERWTQHKLSIGARLSRAKGRYLKYDVTGRMNLVGAIGEFDVNGSVTGSIPLFGDTLGITAYGRIENYEPSRMICAYRSNHYIWNNDFSNSQAYRFGGRLTYPRTRTSLDIGTETSSNTVYFGPNALPMQSAGSVQVFWARLEQKIKLGVFNWDNNITYQTTSNENVIPLPALAIYSNMYVDFRVLKVLNVQLGIDCDYYTRYRAPGYQPATMAFYNQDKMLVGNYPFMNLYINMRLKKARFYVMMSHINQGLTGNNYFSMPHYPLNPRKFQMGISVDFAN